MKKALLLLVCFLLSSLSFAQSKQINKSYEIKNFSRLSLNSQREVLQSYTLFLVNYEKNAKHLVVNSQLKEGLNFLIHASGINAYAEEGELCFFGGWVSKVVYGKCDRPSKGANNSLYEKYLQTEEAKSNPDCQNANSLMCNPLMFKGPTCISISPVSSFTSRCAEKAQSDGERQARKNSKTNADYKNLATELYGQTTSAIKDLCANDSKYREQFKDRDSLTKDCDELAKRLGLIEEREAKREARKEQKKQERLAREAAAKAEAERQSQKDVETQVEQSVASLESINQPVFSPECPQTAVSEPEKTAQGKIICKEPFEGADELTKVSFEKMTFPPSGELRRWLEREEGAQGSGDLKSILQMRNDLIRKYLSVYDFKTCLPGGIRDYSKFCALTHLENLSLRKSKDGKSEHLVMGPAVNGMELAISVENFSRSQKGSGEAFSSGQSWFIVKEGYAPFEDTSRWYELSSSYSTVGNFNASDGTLQFQNPKLASESYEYYGRQIETTSFGYGADIKVPYSQIRPAFTSGATCDDFAGNPYKAFKTGVDRLGKGYDPNLDKDLANAASLLAVEEGLKIGAYNLEDAGQGVVDGVVGLKNLVMNAQTPDPNGKEDCYEPELKGQKCTRMWTLMGGMIENFHETVVKKCQLEACSLPPEQYAQCLSQNAINPIVGSKTNICIGSVIAEKVGTAVKDKIVKCASDANEASRCFAQLAVASATAAATGGVAGLTSKIGTLGSASMQGLVAAGRMSPAVAKWVGRVGNAAKGATNFTFDTLVNQLPASPDDLLNLRNALSKGLAKGEFAGETKELAEATLQEIDQRLKTGGKFATPEAFRDAKPGDIVSDPATGESFLVSSHPSNPEELIFSPQKRNVSPSEATPTEGVKELTTSPAPLALPAPRTPASEISADHTIRHALMGKKDGDILKEADGSLIRVIKKPGEPNKFQRIDPVNGAPVGKVWDTTAPDLAEANLPAHLKELVPGKDYIELFSVRGERHKGTFWGFDKKGRVAIGDADGTNMYLLNPKAIEGTESFALYQELRRQGKVKDRVTHQLTDLKDHQDIIAKANVGDLIDLPSGGPRELVVMKEENGRLVKTTEKVEEDRPSRVAHRDWKAERVKITAEDQKVINTKLGEAGSLQRELFKLGESRKKLIDSGAGENSQAVIDITNEMKTKNSRALVLLKESYDLAKVPTRIDGNMLVIDIDPKRYQSLREHDFYSRIMKAGNGSKLTVSPYDNAMIGSGGFQQGSRIDIGYHEAVTMLSGSYSNIGKHEGRHLLFKAKLARGEDSIYHVQYHASPQAKLSSADFELYSNYMSAEELYNYSTDIQEYAREINRRVIHKKTNSEIHEMVYSLKSHSDSLGKIAQQTYELSDSFVKKIDRMIQSRSLSGLTVNSNHMLLESDSGKILRVPYVNSKIKELADRALKGEPQASREILEYIRSGQESLRSVASTQVELAREVKSLATDADTAWFNKAEKRRRLIEFSQRIGNSVKERHNSFSGR